MRTKKNGQRWFMDESIQRQAELATAAGHVVPTQREAWLSLTRQYLGDVELMAARCGVADQMPVTTIKAALRLLIEYLERNK